MEKKPEKATANVGIFSFTSTQCNVDLTSKKFHLRRPFALWYYDQLARQEEVVRLTVIPDDLNTSNTDDTIESPIEQCIRLIAKKNI